MLEYYPGLRFKQGEYSAAGRLAPDIRRHVHPRFIIPRAKEFDHELQRRPTIDEVAYLTGKRIATNWPVGKAYLDLEYLAADLDPAGLRKVYEIARSQNSEIVPVTSLRNLSDDPFSLLEVKGDTARAIVSRYDELDVVETRRMLRAAAIDPAACVLFLDFTGAVLDPEIAAGSVAAIMDIADQIGRWQRIVFQASNFPSKNPADSGGDELVPRDEWAVFHSALEEVGVSADRIGYGDFAADCGEMNFPVGKGGGRAIRHLRYTTPTHTYVVRGASEGADEDVMRDVCRRIVDSAHYAGQAFSSADDTIFRVAHRLSGPGNASMWREWNTNHHATRVVRDLGALVGRSFTDVQATKIEVQDSLFPMETN